MEDQRETRHRVAADHQRVTLFEPPQAAARAAVEMVEAPRGVRMYVVRGAAVRLRMAEREAFLREEWPEIRSRMDRLGLSPADLALTL